MITVIVADDEKLIRAGIHKILMDSVSVPLNILEAKNGKEALELCRNDSPQLLITDIRMPVMDGITLMREVSALNIRPAVIVLSGYDDFYYAKEAISNGAISYILKPVDKNELVSSVTSAIMRHAEEERRHDEQVLKSVADHGVLPGDDTRNRLSFDGNYVCIAAKGNSASGIMEKCLASETYYIVENRKNWCLIVTPSGSFSADDDGHRKFLEESGISVGVSLPGSDISSLPLLRRQACSSLMQSFFGGERDSSNDGNNAVLTGGISVFTESDCPSDFSEFDSRYEKCIGRLEISSPEEAVAGIDTMLDFSGVPVCQRGAILFYIYTKITNNLFKRFPGYTDRDVYLYLKGIMIENIWQYGTFEEWKQDVGAYAVYLAALIQKDTVEYPFITEALSYIKSHFTKNINMAMCANHVDVNYTYFSEKFKEHTGVNFNEYLKQLRIGEAKRLLSAGYYKVYEVAEHSGFSDVKYFMKVFKEETGMSPGEYRKLHPADE